MKIWQETAKSSLCPFISGYGKQYTCLRKPMSEIIFAIIHFHIEPVITHFLENWSDYFLFLTKVLFQKYVKPYSGPLMVFSFYVVNDLFKVLWEAAKYCLSFSCSGSYTADLFCKTENTCMTLKQ